MAKISLNMVKISLYHDSLGNGCIPTIIIFTSVCLSNKTYYGNLSLGCGQLYVADGNWKLRYTHRMWKVPFSIPGFGNINYKNVCPLSPKRGYAFCEAHCKMATAMGFEAGLKQFYQQCGVADVNIEEGIQNAKLIMTPRVYFHSFSATIK